ncbi:PREDICTED: uncharacterized protein LOC104602902 [Nelumbo nucifera]|uniref:Uncharacterized protein LOC104602902 n=1 Tax=Nelumbo nucifera TaxID=4432 RepID=A0A1U8AH21_NELNU|nr:PREDICTED: uncharacterized protein LOC104602902 [Nelumbo nucifera]
MVVNTDSTISSSTRANPLDTLVADRAALIQLENEVGNSAPPPQTPSAPLTSAFAHSGNRASAHHASATDNTEYSWIIDFGASNYMTGLPSLFTAYHLFSSRDKVSIVDGSLVPISGKGDIKLSNAISLSLVLHVLKLSTNLLSAIFQRYPRPEKEYQSFSLIYSDRSLDLICKDKDEAEVWFVALKALISHGNYRKCRNEPKNDRISSDSPRGITQRTSPFASDPGDTQRIQVPYESPPQNALGKAFSDVISYTAAAKSSSQSESIATTLGSFSSSTADNSNGRSSAVDNFRVSLSSAVSSSSQGSYHEDFCAFGDVFIWGEGTGEGVLGGGMHRVGSSSAARMDSLLPKALESTVVLNVHSIACGGRHAVLVTKKGEIFSWGEESGGRLGHGVEADVSHPKLINTLSGMNIELVACGEYHTCAVTLSGDLYTWGDGTHNSGLLGHGSEASHWIPKKVSCQMEGIHVASISCGPWHTAAVTSSGQLFTFGEGTFGALGHGDRSSTSIPREVESLKGLRTVRVACGVWHTAAVVEVMVKSSSSGSSSSGKLFTWGDGDKGRLGHKDSRLSPARVTALDDLDLCRVACGYDITIALTTLGRVYTMGSTVYGQLGCPESNGKHPTCVEGKISNCFVEEIACGSYHVAILTSKGEVYTWGKGANGQLGHGDNDDRNTPALVEALKDKQVKSVVCGSNFTAIICLNKSVSGTDNSVCSGCHNPFGFRRKRHNCYNCGLVFCKACSSRKSLKASLAPNVNKPYRVCDDCFNKLKKSIESRSISRLFKTRSGCIHHSSSDIAEKEMSNPRLRGQLSRLSSVESMKQAESRQSKGNITVEHNISLNSAVPNRVSLSSLKTSTSSVGYSKNMFSASASAPAVIVGSHATSASMKPNPPRSATPKPPLLGHTSLKVMVDDLKHTNDNLTQEIIRLKAQVEDLTCKSQLLEAELERTSRQLKDATSLAEDKTAKCMAAKEVIKSLTTQLKDMTERVPAGSTTTNRSSPVAGYAPIALRLVSTDSHSTSPASFEPDSNGFPVNLVLCSETKAQNELADQVVQYEPGVYITLTPLPGGGNDIKRIRFSRKHFSEKQAEKWWAENRIKVFQRHNIRGVENIES